MRAAEPSAEKLELRQGPAWASFEQFRNEGYRALEQVKEGAVASLVTKTGKYRVLSEKDFQEVYGLTQEVHRLGGALRLVRLAALAVREHNVPSTVEALLAAVELLEQTPGLAVRGGHEEFPPEGLDLEGDDELILDAAELYQGAGGRE